jgi:hypothetical protein
MKIREVCGDSSDPAGLPRGWVGGFVPGPDFGIRRRRGAAAQGRRERRNQAGCISVSQAGIRMSSVALSVVGMYGLMSTIGVLSRASI